MFFGAPVLGDLSDSWGRKKVLLLCLFGTAISYRVPVSSLLAARVTNTLILTAAASLSAILLGFLGYVVIAAVQAPLGVIVQRHILLGDPPRHSYFAYVTSSYGHRFFKVSIAIYAFFYVAGLVHAPIIYWAYSVSPFDERALTVLMTTNPSSLAVTMLTWFVAFVIAALLSAKSTFAFGAAATDRPGPALRQSFAESRGAMWCLFFTFVLIFILPIFVYLIAAIVVSTSFVIQNDDQVRAGADPFGNLTTMDIALAPQVIIATIVVSTAVMVSYVATAAGAARAYQIRIERGLSGVAEVFS
jgi:MFS family permease